MKEYDEIEGIWRNMKELWRNTLLRTLDPTHDSKISKVLETVRLEKIWKNLVLPLYKNFELSSWRQWWFWAGRHIFHISLLQVIGSGTWKNSEFLKCFKSISNTGPYPTFENFWSSPLPLPSDDTFGKNFEGLRKVLSSTLTHVKISQIFRLFQIHAVQCHMSPSSPVPSLNYEGHFRCYIIYPIF